MQYFKVIEDDYGGPTMERKLNNLLETHRIDDIRYTVYTKSSSYSIRSALVLVTPYTDLVKDIESSIIIP